MAKSKFTLNFFIGLFVVAGFILVAVAIIWFGTSKLFRENFYFVTYFEGSVEGISKGTPVKYLGVPVGSVYEIRVAPDGRMIEVIMVIEKTIKISDSLRVKIELSGLTGGRFLQLFYTNDPYILEWHPKLTFTPPFTLINSAPSGIETLEAGVREAVNRLMEFQFREVSGKIVQFLTDASNFLTNEKLLTTIHDLQQTTEHLSSFASKMDTSNIIMELELASKNIVTITHKLEMFADSLQKEVSDARIASRIDSTFRRADSLINFGTNFVYVFGTKAELLTFTINDLINGLKRSNAMIQKLIREYTINPGQLLLSEPPPKDEK